MSLLARRSRSLVSLASSARGEWSQGSRQTTAVLPTHYCFGGPSLTDTLEERERSSSTAAMTLRGLPQIRGYQTSAPRERAVAIMLGLGTVAAVSYSAAQGVKAYNEWKETWPEEPLEEPENNTTKAKDEKPKEEEAAAHSQQKAKKEGPRENVFQSWFGLGVGAKYYEGGFEETMTRREAALILGVRESSSPARIKEAHRKLLILNHPDTGGSTYMAGKINEAKELLLKGKRGV